MIAWNASWWSPEGCRTDSDIAGDAAEVLGDLVAYL
jgi:hypothetical protein